MVARTGAALFSAIAVLFILWHMPSYNEQIIDAFPSFTAQIPIPSQSPAPIDALPILMTLGPPISLSTFPGPQTYPRALKLRSGALLGVYTAYEPTNTISLSKTHDNGLNWIPYSTVVSAPQSANDSIELNNGFLFELPSGHLLCTFRAHTRTSDTNVTEEKTGIQNAGYLFYRLVIYYSDDEGMTWKYLSTPASDGPGHIHGNWEPFLRLAHNGDLQFYYSREIGGRDQDNLMRVSHDDGITWSEPRIVSGEGMATRDGMMGIEEIVPGGGVLMTVFESVEETGDGEGRFAVNGVVSRDDGQTWGERRVIYETGIWDDPIKRWWKRNAGAPQIARVRNKLVVSFMTDEDKLEGRWHRNAAVKIIVSEDGGLTWGSKMTVAEKPAAWAGLLALNDSSFLVLCEHANRAEVRQVTFT